MICADVRPFWLSPRQVCVVPVIHNFNDYAEEVAKELSVAGYKAIADISSNTMKKKVREAQVAQYNFILVVGAAEQVRRVVV